MINSKLMIGVMSGTSLDGIDIALTEIHRNKVSVIDFYHINYAKKLKKIYLNYIFQTITNLKIVMFFQMNLRY